MCVCVGEWVGRGGWCVVRTRARVYACICSSACVCARVRAGVAPCTHVFTHTHIHPAKRVHTNINNWFFSTPLPPSSTPSPPSIPSSLQLGPKVSTNENRSLASVSRQDRLRCTRGEGIGGINTWLALSNTSIARLEGRAGEGGERVGGRGRGQTSCQ